jgi:hypothetical protein
MLMLAVYVVSMALCRGEYHSSGTSDSREPPGMASLYIQSFLKIQSVLLKCFNHDCL